MVFPLSTEARSAAAAFILAQAGYDVQVLDGGLWSVSRTAQQQIG
ncbi:MAG: hypothetical protein Q8J90_11660 [Gallionella sp.]|nr:hypothetical protein [Gallionella sp.]